MTTRVDPSIHVDQPVNVVRSQATHPLLGRDDKG
jgi:hypothetical protein